MKTNTPRIASVEALTPSDLVIRWKGGGQDRVSLAGWIATGGDILTPLASPEVFGRADVGDYGASVVWDEDGDLAIDAVHLEKLAQAQKPFTSEDVKQWQAAMKVSNNEAAQFLGIAPSTWSLYKQGADIPNVVSMVLRASARDPLLMQAHYKPTKSAGRPKKAAS
jgi:hypothetical protein